MLQATAIWDHDSPDIVLFSENLVYRAYICFLKRKINTLKPAVDILGFQICLLVRKLLNVG